jgi:SpoVK/Ycf46/Vps4 family AAA+-type ATPase
MNWKRADMSVNGTANGGAKRPPDLPLIKGTGDGDEQENQGSGNAAVWEKQFKLIPPFHRFEDIVLPPDVQNELDLILAGIDAHPIVYKSWGLAQRDRYGNRLSLNLHGLSGTGKSFAAEAIAHRLGLLIIRFNYSEIFSKYVGDSAKAIAGACRAAEKSKAVLILDEADALLTRRFENPSTGAEKGVNDVVSEMLTILERYQGHVIFTTNLFGNYDEAFLRRIDDHIEFKPPDFDCRCRLWQKRLPSNPNFPLSPDVTFPRLAEASEGLSGGDMVKIVRKALTRAAVRSGVAGPVTWEDFAMFITREHATRKAHRGNGKVVSETVIDPRNLPAEAKARFDAKEGDAAATN